MISGRKIIRLVALLCVCITRKMDAFVFPELPRSGLTRNHDNAIFAKKYRKHHPISSPRPVNTHLRSTLAQTVSQLSNPASAFTHLTNSVQGTPVIAYFLVLCSAGFGAPISEDLLCIFAGTMLPLDKIQSPARRIRLIAALYLGVVISDLITFSIGRMMKVGLLEPLRKRMNLGQQQQKLQQLPYSEEAGDVAMVSAQTNGSSNEEAKFRKRDRVLQKLESAGDWAGFYARLSAGFRPAMMILAGFSGKVSYAKYTLGTAVGGVISLTAQLLLGYSMRHKPSNILAVSSKLLVIAPAALISGMVVYLICQGGVARNPS